MSEHLFLTSKVGKVLAIVKIFMHRIKSNFDKIMCVLREILGEKPLIFKKQVKPGPKTKFSDLEVIALACTAEYMGFDSENHFFSLLSKDEFTGLLSRRQYNDRRRRLIKKYEEIRKLTIMRIKAKDKLYIVDSMPLKLCRYARRHRNKIGQQEHDIKPNIGYCSAQEEHYYGYKFHAVCCSGGAIQFFDITPASASDVNYLLTIINEKKLNDCYLIGDKGYISEMYKENLKQRVNVEIFTDSRVNAKKVQTIPAAFRPKRKRIETIFSQLTDQFNIQKNYAKTAEAYFTRVQTKILSMTIMNYVQHIKQKPVSQIKYAL